MKLLNAWLINVLFVGSSFLVLFFTAMNCRIASAQTQITNPIERCPVSAFFSTYATRIPIEVQNPYQDRAWRIIDVYADGFSSLDCYLIPPNEMFPGMSHVEILVAWADQERLEQDGIWAVDLPYPHSKMRSKKTMHGREIIFEQRLILFENSFVLATTASDQARFPTLQNQHFLSSLALTGTSR